jgi:hypothetical protein
VRPIIPKEIGAPFEEDCRVGVNLVLKARI